MNAALNYASRFQGSILLERNPSIVGAVRSVSVIRRASLYDHMLASPARFMRDYDWRVILKFDQDEVGSVEP